MSKPKCETIHQGEIWLLIDSLTFGGIETHIRELATGLNQFGQPVRVIILRRYHQPQQLPEALSHKGLSWAFLSDMQPGKNLITQLYNAVRRYKPALLHAHGYKASLCCRAIKLFTGVPQFSTYHAGESPTGKVWLYDWLDRYTCMLSNQAICVSHAIAKKLPGKSLVLNNFISQPRSTHSTGTHIAFIGRLSHEKAPDRFIKLAQKFTHLSFHLYGDGPMYGDLSQKTMPNVTFHGHVKEMDGHWHDIALVIIPSRFEGLPMVSLEAMGRGIPVIATKVGALPTLIEHDVNGWLAESEGSLTTLLKRWSKLSQKEKSRISQKARQTVSNNYTEQAVIPKLITLYQAESRRYTLT